MKLPFVMIGMWHAACGLACAGPYAPAAGQVGSTAILRTSPQIGAWADRVISYQVGTDCLPQWQDTTKSLGPATSDPAHITCLGAGGTITLGFPGFIRNGPGADFVIFENALADTFLECAFVEVSRDGVNYVRFPNHSLTPSAVNSFGSIDPTNIIGLGCKYRQPYGEPYDLADVGLSDAAYVRLVDVVGDGSAQDSDGNSIYDPHPNVQTAGFDLDAIGVINRSIWQTMTIGTFAPDLINATALAHLPDGRFLLGFQGEISVQNSWSQPGRTNLNLNGVEPDPSFIAVRNATSALVGAGGGFGFATGVHNLNPTGALQAVPLATLQNFTGAYWHSPTISLEGWLIGGTNGPTGKHAVSFVSLDGSQTGLVTQELCTYSAGMAVDAGGNLFVTLYELPGSPLGSDAERLLKFSAVQVETAIAAIVSGSPAPLAKNAAANLFKFDSASSLAVDQRGRLWASGPKFSRLQVYDPSNGAWQRVLPDHAPIIGATDVVYQVATFSRNEENYVSYLAQDEAGMPDTSVLYGIAPLSAVTVTETLASWQAFHFGSLPPAAESAVWGALADPDRDGRSNLLEYALHTSPLIAETAPMSVSLTASRLTLAFPRDPLRTDLRYTVEGADALSGPWTELAASEAGGPMTPISTPSPTITETPAAGLIQVSVRDVFTTTSRTKRFLRLRITQPFP